MTQKDLAKELGVAASQINRYIKKGMPFPISVESAKQWTSANILNQGPARLLDVDDDDIDLLIQYEIPEGEEATDALDRLRAEERRLYGQIQGIEKMLSEAPNAKLDRQLSIKRRQWIEASKGATAVWRVIKSINAGNELQEALTASDKYIALILDCIFYWLRTLPQKLPGTATRGGNYPSQAETAELRSMLLKAVRDVFDNVNNLVPNAFAKSGLEDLHQRAFNLVEERKQKAIAELKGTDLENAHLYMVGTVNKSSINESK
jgi:transcriptional regulator with XRE-family HTH domain